MTFTCWKRLWRSVWSAFGGVKALPNLFIVMVMSREAPWDGDRRWGAHMFSIATDAKARGCLA